MLLRKQLIRQTSPGSRKPARGMAEGIRVVGRRTWSQPLIRSLLLRKRRLDEATRARHLLTVSRLPLPQVGGVQIGACLVVWVVQYSIEVDFSRLVECTITSIINLLLVYLRRDFSEGEYQHPASGRDGVSQIFTA